MQDIPDEITRDDLAQWLNRGWYYAIGADGSQTLVRFQDTCSDAGSGGVLAQGYDYIGDTMLVTPPCGILLHWPECGAINTPTGALYVQRLQRRQWTRAYTSRTVQVSQLGAWFQLATANASPVLDGDAATVVRALFDAWYPDSMYEGIDLLLERPSVAINRHITLVVEGPETCGVYYRKDRCGTLEPDGHFETTCGERLTRRVRKLIGDIEI